MDIITLGAARSYTNLVAAGLTSVSVSGTTVTFTLTSGGSASITVPTPADGVDGIDGVSITDVEVDASKHLICTLSNGSTIDAGLVPTVSGADGADGQNGADGVDGEDGVGISSIVKSGTAGLVDTYTINYTDGTTSTFDVTNGANITKVSDLQNDTGFITNVVANLINYYTKTDVYTKSEVAEMLRNIGAGLSVMVVESLPTTDISVTTIYLIQEEGSNSYVQWMYISSAWANLGSTTIDLSAYYTGAQVDTKLNSYVLTTTLSTILGGYTPTASLAAVALSNSYNDLDDLPVIPDISSIIDDNITSTTKTWSSEKVSETLATKANTADLSSVATTGAYSDLIGKPTSLPANGGNASTVNGHSVLKDVPSNAVFTDTTYTAGTNITISDGVISATASGDVSSVNDVEADANGNISLTLDSIPNGSNRVLENAWVGTKAEFDAITTYDDGTTYYTTDESAESVIDDSVIATDKTYSSDKISTELTNTVKTIDDQTVAGTKTFTGSVIPNGAVDLTVAQARKISAGIGSLEDNISLCEIGAIYGQYS